MTFFQAIVIGLLQGIAELFPVSSLGQTILVPALIGGTWKQLVTQQASAESPYLAFIVGLHVATALALISFFWNEWVAVIRGFFSTLHKRRADTVDERMAWLIIIATIPVGLTGLALEHPLRTLFAKPVAAATFLICNGLILLVGEWFRRRNDRRSREFAATVANMHGKPDGAFTSEGTPEGTAAAALTAWGAAGIGIVQTSALLAGISRDGVTMVAGLALGLTRAQAARFAFMLSAPPIFAAGLLKIPDLLGPLGNGSRPQILAGSAAAFLTAYLSVRFLVRYFRPGRSGSLVPFAVFCLLFGVACLIRFAVF